MAPTPSILKYFIILLLSLGINGCSLFHQHQTFAQKAESAARTGNLDEAINNYYLHINERLKEHNRPVWENPYFYLLMIGDLYIQKNDYLSALAKYDEATKQGVDPRLVGDRICLLSIRLESEGKFSTAYKILVQRHQLNPPLFDIALNRVARALSDAEELLRAQTTPKASPSPADFTSKY